MNEARCHDGGRDVVGIAATLEPQARFAAHPMRKNVSKCTVTD